MASRLMARAAARRRRLPSGAGTVRGGRAQMSDEAREFLTRVRRCESPALLATWVRCSPWPPAREAAAERLIQLLGEIPPDLLGVLVALDGLSGELVRV